MLKSIKSRVFGAIFLIFVFFIVLEMLLGVVINSKVSKNSFIVEKFSKAKHMHLNFKDNKIDFVFIGTSVINYNISTNIFKKSGLDIYNYGVDAHKVTDFPYMIKETIKEKPKYILLGLFINDVFETPNDEFEKFKNITFVDLKAFYDTNQSNELKKKALLNYLQRKSNFIVYSESIYKRLHQLYQKFNPKISKQSNKKDTKNEYDYKIPKLDCKEFKTNRLGEHKIVNCTNGDSIIYGYRGDFEVKEYNLTKINPSHLRFVNYLIDTIKANNINVIVLFVPQPDIYNFSTKLLRDSLHTKNIIIHTNIKVPKHFWADQYHFNIIGREYYSKMLSKELLKINL